MFAFQDDRAPVAVAFTDRHGGVSTGPYASLNLADSGGDDPAAVAENQRRAVGSFTGGLDAPVARLRQVHGADVTVVDQRYVDQYREVPAGHAERPAADGVVTALPGVVLMVRVADCVPLLLADTDHGIVGAAHAGRSGMVAGVVASTVARMRQLGAERLVGWVGPHVCGRCYEVPEQMRADVARVVPESYAETSWGTPAVDVGAGVRAQLRASGVEVVDAARCTLEDHDLFSYRRQGKASGRLAGLVWVRP